MEIEFDGLKDAANIAKHSVPFVLGARVIEDKIGQVIDNLCHYGEIRINAFGLVEGRLFVCTDTMRGAVHRIISVRKAGRQEQRLWLS